MGRQMGFRRLLRFKGAEQPKQVFITDVVAPQRPRKQKDAKRQILSRMRLSRHSALVVGGALFLILIAIWLLLWPARKPAASNPFNASVIASAGFPLYYPSTLPPGYAIDTKSVTEPQQGVVVVNLVGPNNGKIYISEEARPTKFPIGNFYARLSNVQEIGVSDGAIATGYDGRTLVASRANNKSWVIANTNAAVSRQHLVVMLKSLVAAY